MVFVHWSKVGIHLNHIKESEDVGDAQSGFQLEVREVNMAAVFILSYSGLR